MQLENIGIQKATALQEISLLLGPIHDPINIKERELLLNSLFPKILFKNIF